MYRIFILVFFGTLFLKSSDGQSIKVFSENKEGGSIIYVSNPEIYPVSISLDLSITNLIFSEGNKTIFVVPPLSSKYKIGELTIDDKTKRTNYSYKYLYIMGDATIKKYEKAYPYDLPFKRGNSYTIFQAYNGNFSHQNENALDFTMPIGSEILAAREGIVVRIVQNNTESCTSRDCAKFNNYVTVMHSDGTFSEYIHIKTNSVNLKIGDNVKKGDIIALSGNVGWSSGPHLHFVCYLPMFEKRISLETKFKIDKGEQVTFLTEGQKYFRDY